MPTFIGSTPTIQEDDIQLCRDIQKKRIETKGSTEKLAINLEKRFKTKPYLFNRGRDALYFILKLMDIKEGDEVLTQAFSCIAVSAPILWSKAKPVYVDIDKETFNMNLGDLKKKITERTKAIIVQHTFGNKFETKLIRNYLNSINRNIFIIEDYAHSFDNPGSYSDAVFFSFAQDKCLTCVQGGLAILNNHDLSIRADNEYKQVSGQSEREARYNTKYILSWDFIKKSYFSLIIPFAKNDKLTIGKGAIVWFRKLGIIKQQASSNIGLASDIRRISDIQSSLLLNQLSKEETFSEARIRIVKKYNMRLRKNFIFKSNTENLLRYPVLLKNPQDIMEALKKEKIIAGRWYSSVIFPKIIPEYTPGSCPNAEFCARYVVNIPVNIDMGEGDIDVIINIVNNLGQSITNE